MCCVLTSGLLLAGVSSRMGSLAMDTNCMTLNRFILQEQRNFPQATGDLTHLLSSILTAVKAISTAVRRAGMTNM